jgi:ribose transport system substrate-binding protein
MQPRLTRFVDFLLPPVVGDFSRESLVGLEAQLLERFPDPERYYQGDGDRDVIDGAVRYVGETYLRAFGGGWKFSDDPRFVVAGRPYVLLGTPDATPISPFNLMGAALQKDPDIVGVFAANLFAAEGTATAVRQAGKSSTVKIVSFDAGPNQVKSLREGTIQALVAQQPSTIGQYGVDEAVAALDGGQVTPKVQTGFTIITKDNIDGAGAAAAYKSSC